MRLNPATCDTKIISVTWPQTEGPSQLYSMWSSEDLASMDNATLEACNVPTNSTVSQLVSQLEEYPDWTQVCWVRRLFIVLYLMTLVLSVLGNVLVCVTVARDKKMHTAVNYYIVNLGLCDLLVGSFVLPVKLLEMTAPAAWFLLSGGLCTAIQFLQTIVVFTSVLTLVATCVERYLAIVYPLESRRQHSKRRVKMILVAVWLSSCAAASPNLYPWDAGCNILISDLGVIARITCFDNFSEGFRKSYFLTLFFTMYLLPLAFIAATCIRICRVLLHAVILDRHASLRRQHNNRRKVAKMVMVVVAAFVISWTPYFLVTVITQLQQSNFLHHGQFFFTMLTLNLFGFINSCVNPFIYAAMSARFRNGFRQLLAPLHHLLGIGIILWILRQRHPRVPPTASTAPSPSSPSTSQDAMAPLGRTGSLVPLDGFSARRRGLDIAIKRPLMTTSRAAFARMFFRALRAPGRSSGSGLTTTPQRLRVKTRAKASYAETALECG